jgi:putative GTP pyrophosphokinase
MTMDESSNDEFLLEYQKHYLSVLAPTQDALRSALQQWRSDGFWSKYNTRDGLPAPSPVQRIKVRIKRPESVVDKIHRKPKEYPAGVKIESLKGMHDVVGGRVIVYFLSQLQLIDRELRSSGRFDVLNEPAPVAYLRYDQAEKYGLAHLERRDKDSGYASLHYCLRLRGDLVPEADRPVIELQVRTITEDLWGEVEHVLGYKPGKRTSFAVKRQFQVISGQLSAIDEHFDFLNEELRRYQQEARWQNTDPLNTENLPAVLASVEVGCDQDEIDALLRLLFSRGIRQVQDFFDRANFDRLQRIRQTYIKDEGRNPSNFELVATIATLSGSEAPKEVEELTRRNIAFLKAWDAVRNRPDWRDG